MPGRYPWNTIGSAGDDDDELTNFGLAKQPELMPNERALAKKRTEFKWPLGGGRR